MKSLIAAGAVTLALSTPAVAFAQASAPPPAPPAPSPAGAAPLTRCTLGDHAGIDEADALTAWRLVCAEVARAGGNGARYVMSLGKLGSVVILSVSREGEQPGTIADTRQIRLQGVEEVSVAGPRIAESIVHGTPLAETERVDNLVGEETRQPKTKAGETHFGVGLVGVAPPLDRGLTPAPGVNLDLHYETGSGRFEIGGSMRFGGASDNDRTTTVLDGFFVLSIGGRYYAADTDLSPYIGGGITWSWLDVSVAQLDFQGNANGLGAYVDGGVEVLRTHHAHLAIGPRLDIPFYSISGSGGTYNAQTSVNLYYLPVSIEARLTF